MSNSPLVTYTRLSPNCNSPRNHAIDTITIHCTAGQGTAQSILGLSSFTKYDPVNGYSCNYVVGKDGSIGLCVEESSRSWCSSNRDNDHRAITIEVSSDSYSPYKVTEKALASLIDLLVDICQRNGIKRLVWSTNKADRVNHRNGCNMTCHRDFANKACPGDYLYALHGDIAESVNKRLEDAEEVTQEQFNSMMETYLTQQREKETSTWSAASWERAKEAGVFDGTAPQAQLSREQAALVLDRLGLLEKE